MELTILACEPLKYLPKLTPDILPPPTPFISNTSPLYFQALYFSDFAILHIQNLPTSPSPIPEFRVSTFAFTDPVVLPLRIGHHKSMAGIDTETRI